MILRLSMLFLAILLLMHAKNTSSYPFKEIINGLEAMNAPSTTVTDWSPETVPFASTGALKKNIEEFLSRPSNSDEENPMNGMVVKLAETFKKYGLLTELQVFPANLDEEENLEVSGVNVVGTLKGINWGTDKDQITIIGSHYDTVADSPGVDDNRSGLSAMLEVARVMTARCKLNNSVMFAAFDLEEYGSLGSRFFVNKYFIPEHLLRSRATLRGAFILDNVLNFNETEFSQTISKDLELAAPDVALSILKNGQRGNFLQMVSRENFDNDNAEIYMKHWQSLGNPSMEIKNVVLPETDSQLMGSMLKNYPNFLRSDHSSFWLHDHMKYLESLPAVFISDSGPFRGRMKKCYHKDCDDRSMLTDKNLDFLKKTTDALIKTVLSLGEGMCGVIKRRNDKVRQSIKPYQAEASAKMETYKPAQQDLMTNRKMIIQSQNELGRSSSPMRKYKREAVQANNTVDGYLKPNATKKKQPALSRQIGLPQYLNSYKQRVGVRHGFPGAHPGSNFAMPAGSPSMMSQHASQSIISAAAAPNQMPTSFAVHGNYILPDDAILAQPPGVASQQQPPTPMSNLQNPVSAGNMGSSSLLISPSQVQINPSSQPLISSQFQIDTSSSQPMSSQLQSASPSSLASLLTSGAQLAESTIAQGNLAPSILQQAQNNPSRRITVPAGLLLARNVYSRFITGLRRFAPFFG